MTILIVIITLIVSYLLLFFAWRIFFLRNPKRYPPLSNAVVSPADGYVVYIKRVEKGQVIVSEKQGRRIDWAHVTESNTINSSGYLIGIAMTPFSAHRNYIPYTGTIEKVYYKKFHRNKTMLVLMAKIMLKFPFTNQIPNSTLENEKLTLKITSTLGDYYVTQIAGDTINRIVIWIRENQKVNTGFQYGMIRFGSQCDVFLPDPLCAIIKIKVGEYLYAGQSVITEPCADGKDSK